MRILVGGRPSIVRESSPTIGLTSRKGAFSFGSDASQLVFIGKEVTRHIYYELMCGGSASARQGEGRPGGIGRVACLCSEGNVSWRVAKNIQSISLR